MSTTVVVNPFVVGGAAPVAFTPVDVRAASVVYAQTAGPVEFGNSWDRTYPVALGTNKRVSGFRFQVNVPQGATITSATLKTTHSQNATWVAPSDDLEVSAEAADSTTTATNEPDAQTKSENLGIESVTWSIDGYNANGTVFTTPSLVDVIQEVVDRAGWASGNHLTLWAVSDGGGSVDSHQMWAVTGVTETNKPRLHITGTYIP